MYISDTTKLIAICSAAGGALVAGVDLYAHGIDSIGKSIVVGTLTSICLVIIFILYKPTIDEVSK